MKLIEQLDDAVRVIHHLSPLRPRVAVVLGSGLGFLADELTEAALLPYHRIPHFKASCVAGHAGSLLVGRWKNIPVLLFSGRIHLYEGHTPQEVCFGVRVAVRSGANTLIITNAAGTLREDWNPGDIMVLRDHLNLQGINVLAGPDLRELGPRFPDLSNAYDAHLRSRVLEAVGVHLPLRSGVYAGLLGPTYETPAEVRMLRALGADAVGMSTVQETIAAHHMGARVLAFSILTNQAAGVSPHPLSHAEVQDTANMARHSVEKLLFSALEVCVADE